MVTFHEGDILKMETRDVAAPFDVHHAKLMIKERSGFMYEDPVS